MSAFLDSITTAAQLIGQADPVLWQTVSLSLRVSGTACLLGTALGLALGAVLAVSSFPGQRVAILTVNTLLAMPSVVVGLIIYLLLSRAGPLGSWGILFTPTAMVMAQSVLVVPLIAALALGMVLLAVVACINMLIALLQLRGGKAAEALA